MTKCPFKVGKTYKTRDGRDALILYYNPKNTSHKQLNGIVHCENGGTFSVSWNPAGRVYNAYEIGIDLIPPEHEKKIVEGWFNIYSDSTGGVLHQSKELADSRSTKARTACIYIKQEYVVGEGLNNDESGFV